jgi:predicted RNA-binding protein with EMAP domain
MRLKVFSEGELKGIEAKIFAEPLEIKDIISVINAVKYKYLKINDLESAT